MAAAASQVDASDYYYRALHPIQQEKTYETAIEKAREIVYRLALEQRAHKILQANEVHPFILKDGGTINIYIYQNTGVFGIVGLSADQKTTSRHTYTPNQAGLIDVAIQNITYANKTPASSEKTKK